MKLLKKMWTLPAHVTTNDIASNQASMRNKQIVIVCIPVPRYLTMNKIKWRLLKENSPQIEGKIKETHCKEFNFSFESEFYLQNFQIESSQKLFI